MISSGDVYAFGVPIILLMILLEACFSAWRNRRYYQLADVGGTIGLLAGNVIVSALVKSFSLGIYFYCYQFRAIDIAAIMPLWAQWVLAFAMIDLVFYWYHRCFHRVRFLWAIHMNHHCSQQMNFTVSFRQAWFGPISKIPFFVALPLIGLDPSITVVAGVVSTLWGVIGHTRVIPRLDPITEFIFNTPSAHRVHHGTNAEYLDKNFGNLLMIWDRLFGTYAKEQNAPIYGLINNLNTNNPFVITFCLWREIIRDIRQASTRHEIWMAIFGPPGWRSASVDDSAMVPAEANMIDSHDEYA